MTHDVVEHYGSQTRDERGNEVAIELKETVSNIFLSFGYSFLLRKIVAVVLAKPFVTPSIATTASITSRVTSFFLKIRLFRLSSERSSFD
jgi:hypothetical protein